MKKLKQTDLQAIVDLTADSLQNIIAPIFPTHKIGHLSVKVIKGVGGASYREERLVTIPQRAFDISEEFAIYYVVHEVSHQAIPISTRIKEGPRGKMYKWLEDKALELWGLKIKRMKAYPQYIYNDKGQVVYDRKLEGKE